ncbi:MAG: hypothetical protein V3573_10460 [Desulfovibrionaceae bacterium]
MQNNDQRLQQELAELKREYERLKEEKVRAEQDAANLAAQLAGLKAQAEAEYGTSDAAQLQALLEEKRAENGRLVAEYRAHLEGIRQGLDAVERTEGDI